MKKTLAIGTLQVLTLSCGSSNFKGADTPPLKKAPAPAPARKSADAAPAPARKDLPPVKVSRSPPPAPVRVSADVVAFDVTSIPSPVDLVWAIDTSDSMQEEVDKVRTNLGTFLDKLSAHSDARMHMVAKDSGQIRLELPQEILSRMNVVSMVVHSHNAFSALAASICPPETSSATRFTLCGENLVDPGNLIDAPAFKASVGKLGPSLRPEARKVFVVVTDDNARPMKAQKFSDLMQIHLKGEFTFYGFVGSQAGKTSESCDIAEAGTEYEDLALKTGGATFDMCDEDWSKSFATLLDGVLVASRNAFPLGKDAGREIMAVKVDGKEVQRADWTVQGSNLIVKRSLLKTGAKVEIRFAAGAAPK